MKKIKKLLQILIGLLIIGILIYKTGPQKIIETLINIKKVYLIPILILYLISLLLGAINIYLLIKKIKNIKFSKILDYYLIGWMLGFFIPGKIGEFSILYYLKKDKISYGEGLAISIIDKSITLFFILTLVIITAIIFLNKIYTYLLLILLIILVVILIVFIKTKIIKKFMPKYITKKFKKFKKTLIIFTKQHKKELILNLTLTVIKTFINGIIIYTIFLSLNTYASFLMVFLISSSLTILTLIPITINGLGLKEALGIYLYNMIGINPEVVITTSIINILVMYSSSLIIIIIKNLTDKYLSVTPRRTN